MVAKQNMDVSSCVPGFQVGLGAVGEGVFSGAPGPKVRVSLSGWMRATLFLFDHQMGYDEATVKE